MPALLAEARTDEGVTQVLELVKTDPKMAKLLATELLAAKTEDAAAAAFAHVAEIAITAGTDDPEVIMRAKIDSIVSKYVMGGEMAMAKIKEAFNKAASAAQNSDDLDAALQTAAQAADDKVLEIEADLTDAVGALAGAYDLTEAQDRIKIALAAGRA